MSEDKLSPTLELTVRSALPVVIFKIVVLEIVFVLLYAVLLFILNDYSPTPLKSGGILIFLFIQSVKFFFGLFILLKWFFHSYDITSEKIIIHQGIVFQQTRYFSLRKVETLRMNQGFWGRIFGFGTIHVELYIMAQKYDVCLTNISQPDRYLSIIEKRLKALKGSDNDSEE